MMSPSTVIEAKGLGKSYRLAQGDAQGRAKAGYGTLRESIVAAAGGLLKRRGRPGPRPASVPFWALRDLDFRVEAGEVLGVIGHNGAGKSTLLKVLARITRPSEGSVTLRGRVGSLLEVGTGFHPELTGRENVTLNGAILGMSRREVARKFDEIVAFSGVEKFLDTPVKRYSSGMYVRLAFAVAAHFEAEALLIDEVLAVGDAEFQRKCLERIRDLCDGGRTVLFVSHNLAAVQNLCTRALVLERGRAEFQGPVEEAIRRYVAKLGGTGAGSVSLRDHPARMGGSTPILSGVRLCDADGSPTGCFPSGGPMRIELELDPPKDCPPLLGTIHVEDGLGQRLFTLASELAPGTPAASGGGRLRCLVEELPLKPGRYLLTLRVAGAGHQPADVLTQATGFDVIDADFYGTGQMPRPRYGPVLVRSRWEAIEA